jgi:hypothetical protein
LMACRASEGLTNFSLLEWAYSHTHIALLNISLTAESDGSSAGRHWALRLSTVPPCQRQPSPALPRTAKEFEIGSPSVSSSIVTGPHCPRIPAYPSTSLSSTRSADRSPTSGGG